jgi:hypothetical protein
MIESETIAAQLRLEKLHENRSSKSSVLGRRTLNEAFDPFSMALTFVTVVGGIGLVLTFLRWVFEKIGNKTGMSWASKTGSWFSKVEHAWHHAEAVMVDILLPDRVVVELYNFYIWSGGTPVEGDAGRMEKSYGDEVFGTGGFEAAPVYTRGKLQGKAGSSRQLSVDDIRVTDSTPEDERERRRVFRESVEKRIWTIMIFILLVQAVTALVVQGLSMLYALKSGVKAGEIGVHIAPEVGAAVRGMARGAELTGVELLGAAAGGAAAGAGAMAAARRKD